VVARPQWSALGSRPRPRLQVQLLYSAIVQQHLEVKAVKPGLRVAPRIVLCRFAPFRAVSRRFVLVCAGLRRYVRVCAGLREGLFR
jgi:hypothetical protein